MKNIWFIFYDYDKFTGILRIRLTIIYPYPLQHYPDFLLNKIRNSNLLLDNCLSKLYNNLDYILYSGKLNNTIMLDMNMHRQPVYDIPYDFFRLINLPLRYIISGLVIILGVLIVKWVKSYFNDNRYKSRASYKSKNFTFDFFFDIIKRKSKNFIFYDQFRVFTSHISSWGPSLGLGGAGGDDGDEGDRNWRKYELNKEKINERNRLNKRIGNLRSWIFNNLRERDRLIQDLSELTAEIEANRVYWDSRSHVLPEEDAYNRRQLEIWNTRSITINSRLEAIVVENAEYNRELAYLESLTNTKKGRKRKR